MCGRIELSNCLMKYRKIIHNQVDVTNQWSVDKLVKNGAEVMVTFMEKIKLVFIFTWK